MKIYLDMIGCRLNQAELEKIAAACISQGHKLVDRPGDADIAIINTCTVTSAAAADSRQLTRRIIQQGAQKVYVTGCWATMDFSQASKLLPENHIFENTRKDALVSEIFNQNCAGVERITVRPEIPGRRSKTRAFIKVQDGCNHACTYCVTRLARGRSFSVPQEEVIQTVNNAIQSGCREVVLCGVSLGNWGKDFSESQRLEDLTRRILRDTAIERLRFSSIEPWDIDDSFLEVFKEPRICRHLHLPLQSGSEEVLKKMNRPFSAEEYKSLTDRISTNYPDLAITTDVIAGFPGEGKEQFNESADFIQALKLSGGHVFPFSRREKTLAASMPDQVDGLQKKQRAEILRSIFQIKQAEFRKKHRNQYRPVLWEHIKARANDGISVIEGFTDNYIHVACLGDESKVNTITNHFIK